MKDEDALRRRLERLKARVRGSASPRDSQRRSPLDEADGERPVRSFAGPVAFELTLTATTSLRVDGDGSFELPPGRYPIRLYVEPSDTALSDERVEVVPVRVEADTGDGTWSTRTEFGTGQFTVPVTDPDLAVEVGLVFWRDAPERWRTALQSRCLVAGLTGLLDDRERFELPVGSETVTMMLKYQGPEVDVAWLADQGRLVVRVGAMYYEVWRGGDLGEIVHGATFAYLLDPVSLLPFGSSWWQRNRRWEPWRRVDTTS